ncbi:MAG TPA: DUF748 domain-containing protein, partial [Flavobacteriaceae bacterium]|nr:DUF748 domain-containing protein [Flavobacteriaceae bacterium]
ASKNSVPLLNFPKTDISIEWRALLKGEIVSEIEMYHPQVNYIFEEQQKPNPTGDPKLNDWSEALTDLVPIRINRLLVHDGKIGFVQLSADPNIDLMLNDLELVAINLRNVRDVGHTLPSVIKAKAVSFGNGNFSLDGKMDLMQRIPDMDIGFSLKNADVTALNDLTNRYAGVDFASGTFEMYSEFAIADGYLQGYLKPMFIDTKLLGKEDKDGFFKTLWEGFVGVFKFLFKNQGTDTLATKVPLEGDLTKVDTGIFSTILNIFKNAWIQAFTTKVEGDIEFEDALNKEKE